MPLCRAHTLLCSRRPSNPCLQKRHSDRRQVLGARRIQPGTHAARVLREGDIILAVDGTAVSCFRDVEEAVIDKESVTLTVLRDGDVSEIVCETDPVSGDGTGRFVVWAGALLQQVTCGGVSRARLGNMLIAPERHGG